MGDVSLHPPVKAEPATHAIAQANEITNLMMSPGWTDERHTLYISSMESSFMDQLYKRGRDANQNDSSANGFKVLRGGVWEKLNFERTNARAPVTAKCRLPANPWIQRFRPRDCSSNTRGDEAETVVGDHESGIRTVRGSTPLSHGRELGACQGENLLDENTEVSGQNFSDDEAEVDAESSQLCKKRRLSSTSTYCAPLIK
ncbi:cold-regulated protein 27-like [Lolium rigidum]|uniref:cold-regulated protein 27-like n=1 Tax=Lolium rigidum TaxID=89674 RepID=UPI001F5DCBB5|nr:cold-regulated protein 27-like [Lolium rigidum]